ncbi:MAG: T9SS type A sorting domain-containing protein [Candidatus Marinimicrobia bacterium]|nr:T9SS type A sorting domain-containing protein [Candidatus Neomarinimicrobiota bacterium]
MFHLLISFILLLAAHTSMAQEWQQNDLIFNPSGIPSLPFSQPRFADLDNDGDNDLILGNINEPPLYFENTGSATLPQFQPGAQIFSGVQALDCEVGVCIDLDNDNDLDFISGGYNGLQLYENIGTNQNAEFSRRDDFFNMLAVGINPVPHFSDLDNDGDFDLVVGLSESGEIRYYQNSGTAEAALFTESLAEMWFDVGLYAYPWFSDLDADGDIDLLAGRDGYGFFYYRNDGDQSSWSWTNLSSFFSNLGQNTYWNSPCLVDLTGDGKLDLVHGTASGPLLYYVNSGSLASPSWTAVTSLFGGVIDVGGASNPVFTDFDNDGDLDMLSGSQGGDIKYYENTGTPNGSAWIANHSRFSGIDHSIYSAVAAGDLDADGLIDLVVGDLSGNLFYHHNSGTGFPYVATMFSGINVGGWSSPRLYDFDGDQDLDLFIGRENGQISYYENTGNMSEPVWTENSSLFSGIHVGSNAVLTLGDVNLDGNLDMIVGKGLYEVKMFTYENRSWVELPDSLSGLTVGQNATPGLADLDGDGDLDLVVGNYTGTFNYFENLTAVGIDIGPETPDEALLFPAYPNPFNPSTTLRYELQETAHAGLKIYDLSGTLVQTLVEGSFGPGVSSVSWNAKSSSGLEVASGVYLAVLETDNTRQVIRLTFLK